MKKETEIDTEENLQNNIVEGGFHAPLRMRQGNCILLSQIPFTPSMFDMCDQMELTEVRPAYDYDDDNKPILDRVSAINYICVDGKSWYNFKVPNQIQPLIAQEEIDRRDAQKTPVIVRIPLEKLVFKPYQSPTDKKGTVHFSLIIPFIEVL